MTPEAAEQREPNARSPVRVSIIIPVYNEIRSVAQVLDRVIRAPLPEGCEKERDRCRG